jgi:hypothetical protein
MVSTLSNDNRSGFKTKLLFKLFFVFKTFAKEFGKKNENEIRSDVDSE